MHIDVIGRIRPSQRGEGPHTLEIDGHNRIASRPDGTYFKYANLNEIIKILLVFYHEMIMTFI